MPDFFRAIESTAPRGQTFSTAAALRHMAHRAGGAALGSLLLGLVVGHLALLGGAFFLAAAAAGFVRRAKKAAAA